MPMNSIQFQHGLSLPEFFERYGTEQQCIAALEQVRWPDGFVCPRCQGTSCSRIRTRTHPLYQCCSCRHQSSLTAGTVLQATKLPLTQWFFGYVSDRAGQERHLGAVAGTPAWGELPHRLAAAPQAHGRHGGPARRTLYAARRHPGR